ncbi:MAG: hypothetical protein JSW55_05120 [Chloroflexota bacterium]|nr:MAG: hypothetical protein JSW55_05120 [Chloroflexota bacterium]
MSKGVNGNRIENGNQDWNEFPDFVWVLPFVMVGAMFGSLAGAGLGVEMGYQTPFAPAVIGAILGMLVVTLAGWWLSHGARLR